MARETLIRGGKLLLLLLLAVVLQAALASQFSFLGVSADVFVILVVLVAVANGATTGLIFGFTAGFVADLVYLDPVGMRTFMYLMVGYWIGRYVEEFGLASAWLVVFLAGGVSLAAQVFYGVLQVATGAEGSFLTMVWSQMLPAALFDGLLSAPLYLGLTRVRLLTQPQPIGPMFG